MFKVYMFTSTYRHIYKLSFYTPLFMLCNVIHQYARKQVDASCELSNPKKGQLLSSKYLAKNTFFTDTNLHGDFCCPP
ncbi:hypothetical protein GDO81_003493 [Engystomops pustulosus]|uniref:Uncharacterized protein n=1 Tax=Engystomops pustulosus TaxID=76066 RepID=A0AAV6ZWD0_ENGPU|nr:hypothetical protein GDO81_003493 [Engystomops pustulosus]